MRTVEERANVFAQILGPQLERHGHQIKIPERHVVSSVLHAEVHETFSVIVSDEMVRIEEEWKSVVNCRLMLTKHQCGGDKRSNCSL